VNGNAKEMMMNKSLTRCHTEQEREHRRTARHPEVVRMMAEANHDAVEPLAVAMGLCTAEEYAKQWGEE
jgi:chloramphenicol 3-O-phosphotransferase